ncbi:hypothetical protein R6Q59_035961 [Mikania micrantha]
MEVERLCSGVSCAPVAEAFDLMVQTVVVTEKSVTWLLFLIGLIRNNADALSDLLEAEKRFPFNNLNKVLSPDAECKNNSENEDDSDDDEDADAGNDSDNDAGDSSEEEDDDDDDDDDEHGGANSDSDANDDEDSDDDDDEDDDDDDDDDEDDDDDGEDSDEDEAEDNQPPFKKRMTGGEESLTAGAKRARGSSSSRCRAREIQYSSPEILPIDGDEPVPIDDRRLREHTVLQLERETDEVARCDRFVTMEHYHHHTFDRELLEQLGRLDEFDAIVTDEWGSVIDCIWPRYLELTVEFHSTFRQTSGSFNDPTAISFALGRHAMSIPQFALAT